ncbi:hypothetical protein D7M11_24045 [Paenibacillus ginsengarvi]|uniref:Uncharacterized protein n=1 Tax=Paenibacillus ginsengarvi TaxID=400777 RepID=A0A3B0C094_9BACL|nr:hypothetical protein D7M11_24045 [Paenibacillus ginsengarvi]
MFKSSCPIVFLYYGSICKSVEQRKCNTTNPKVQDSARVLFRIALLIVSDIGIILFAIETTSNPCMMNLKPSLGNLSTFLKKGIRPHALKKF